MAPRVGLLRLPILSVRNALSYFQGVPPLGLAYVASHVRKAGFPLTIIDALGEAVDQFSVFHSGRFSFQLQGLTVPQIADRIPGGLDILGIGNMFLHEMRFLEELVPAIRARHPDLHIVFGGETASGIGKDLLLRIPGITALVIGEGEEPFISLIAALGAGQALDEIPSLVFLRDGKVIETPPGDRIQDINALGWPAWDLFPVEQYLRKGLMSGVNRGRSMPMLTSRGCPFQCTFCSAPSMWGTRYFVREPEEVVREIEHLMKTYAVTNIDFQDLSSMVTKRWVKEFHGYVKARKLEFTWQIPGGTRSEALDAETLQLMYDSGCRNFAYAVESGSPEILAQMKKRVNLDKITRSMRSALTTPLTIHANIIIGYPLETRKDHWRYFKLIVRLAALGVHSLAILAFNPYPGSADFKKYRGEGRIDFDDDAYVYGSLLRGAGQKQKYHPTFSASYIKGVQLTFLLAFWTVQYLLHPGRALRVLRNLSNHRQETIMEQFLAVKFHQWFLRHPVESR